MINTEAGLRRLNIGFPLPLNPEAAVFSEIEALNNLREIKGGSNIQPIVIGVSKFYKILKIVTNFRSETVNRNLRRNHQQTDARNGFWSKYDGNLRAFLIGLSSRH